MPIPGREIYAEAQAIFAGGARHVADDIAFPAAPRAPFHAVVRLLSGPQAKAIVMLGDEHHIFCACRANGFHPLLGIEFRRAENIGARRAVAPLAIEEGVGRKVNDHAELEILPGGLIRSGADVAGGGLRGGHGRASRTARGGYQHRSNPSLAHSLDSLSTSEISAGPAAWSRSPGLPRPAPTSRNPAI